MTKKNIIFLLLFGLLLTTNSTAQVSDKNLKLLDEIYLADSADDQVKYWKTLMKAPAINPQAIVKAFPTVWKLNRVTDEKMIKRVENTIKPAMNFFGKNYEVFLVEFDKPVLIIDSDCVLVLTTELLKEVKDDDELLGLALHEIAHSLYSDKSIQLQELLTGKKLKAEAQEQLALIELSCDAFAVRSMMALKRQPLKFLEFIVECEKKYKSNGDDSYHPSGDFRLKLGQRWTIQRVIN